MMCIIVSKPKGVEMPSKTILKNCFNKNSDGAGLMYVENGNVCIRKGFMTFERFYEYIEKLNKIHDLTNKAMVMHFRISTGGNVDGGNCHPYPISSNRNRLRKLNVTTKLGMAHNGIINDYSNLDLELNDTQMFIKDCVSTIYDYDKEFFKKPMVMNMLKNIASSKLCFLDSDENIYYVGDFTEDNGIMYSNTGYKTYYSYPMYNYSYGGKTLTKSSSKNSYGGYNYWYDDFYYDDYIDEIDDDEYLGKYDEVIDKLLKDDNFSPLTPTEFKILFNNLNILREGTTVEGGGNRFKVPNSENYGIDSFYNVYYVDYENQDMYPLYYEAVLSGYPRDVGAFLSDDELNILKGVYSEYVGGSTKGV